jgi:flagellar hook-length control protein FliK
MLKSLSAISAPSGAALTVAVAASGETPRAAVAFGAVLMAAQQAVKGTMPLPDGKIGAPTARAGQIPAPEPMVESEAAPAPPRASYKSPLVRAIANSDELLEHKPPAEHPAGGSAPADPVTTPAVQLAPLVAEVLAPAARPGGKTPSAPPANLPSATPGAARRVPALPASALPPSPTSGMADKVTPGSLEGSGARQAIPSPIAGKQSESPSNVLLAGNGQNKAVVAASSDVSVMPLASTIQNKPGDDITPRPMVAAAAGSPARVPAAANSAVLGGTKDPLGGAPAPPITPSARTVQDKPTAAVTTQPAIAGTTSVRIMAETIPAVPSDAPGSLRRSTVPPGTPSDGTSTDKLATGLTPQPAVAATASSTSPLAAVPLELSLTPRLTPGEQPRNPSGVTGAANVSPLGTTYQPVVTSPSSPTSLADTLQRMTEIGIEDVSLSKGTGNAALGLGTSATDLIHPLAAVADTADGRPLFGVLEAHNLAADVDLTGAGVPDSVPAPVVRQSEREAESGQMQEPNRTRAVDPQSIPVPTNDIQAPQTGEVLRSLPGNSGSALSVTNQIAPAVVALAQGHDAGGRLSISITPDQLGQVHITVERAADGTTSVHVAAEQLATLDLLRQDQANLNHALNQAGVGSGGHSLSFSWGGGGGGMPGWGTPSHQPNDGPPADVIGLYSDTEEFVSAPSASAAARGGIDVTA